MEILLFIFVLLVVIITAFVIIKFLFKVDDKKLSFFTLSLVHIIGIFIFSVIMVVFAFQNDDNSFWIFGKKIIITNTENKQVLRGYPIATISGTTIKGDGFSGDLFYLSGANLVNGLGSGMVDYVSKTDMKDIYMEQINKRIESSQNLLTVFFTFITIFLSVIGYLGFKSIDDFKEKSDKLLADKKTEFDQAMNDKLVADLTTYNTTTETTTSKAEALKNEEERINNPKNQKKEKHFKIGEE